jgi:DNA (cytosine-5)-methyltransferase 1
MSEDQRYKADIITGGFPCQPFSVAGKRKGTADDRYLWDETIRVITECKARWFIGENVEGLININNGMVLRQVQTDLEEQGFQVQCLVIPASGIGAWHQRKRIWIIAYSHNNGSYRSQRNETKQSSNKQEDRLSFRDDKDVPNTNTGFSIRENQEIQTGGNATTNGSKDVSNSNSDLRKWRGAEFQSGDDREWWFCSKKEKQTKYDIRSETIGCDDIFGEEKRTTWWQTQSEFCGVPNGVSYELDKDRSSRIKALGNSIVPQIARQLGLAIMKAETE